MICKAQFTYSLVLFYEQSHNMLDCVVGFIDLYYSQSAAMMAFKKYQEFKEAQNSFQHFPRLRFW